MPALKVSKAYKLNLGNQIKKKYRTKWKDVINYKRRMEYRSRLGRFNNGLDTDSSMNRTEETPNRRTKIDQTVELTLEQKKIARKKWLKCVKQYELEIRQYYSHVCNCCGRIMRQSQLKKLEKTALNISNDVINKVFYVKNENVSNFCKTCASYIEKDKIPRVALCNGLNFPKVDKSISALNRIEERLLAPRHVFQSLWTHQGPHGQLKTKGGIVNVPVEIDTNVQALPRKVSDSHIIHIRVARRMSYVKDFMSGVVRPRLLYDAAKKFVSKPLPKEEGIKLNLKWKCSSTAPEDFNLSDDEHFVQNAIYETMLTNDKEEQSFCHLMDKGIRIAPAEDYCPKSILFDDNCEFLAFPKVFGGYKMEPEHDGKKLPYSDFAKSMALRYDRRVAERGDLLLFIAKKLEILKLYNNIGICLRKKAASNSITASQLLNSSYISGLVQHNDGYKVLRGVRSSPAHWQQEKTKLMAQIRQFGLPTFFLTLSAADTKWPELLVALKQSVDNKTVTEEDAMKFTSAERARLIQKDPITCALHFDQRFKALKKTWDCSSGPFMEHKISHFYYRVEFQQRGSPHVHMLIWIKDAPMYDPLNPDSRNAVCNFIDQIVSCSSDDLPEELRNLQVHHHTHTCYKKFSQNECRFDIPYFPMIKTTILTPLKISKKKQSHFKNVMKRIKKIKNKKRALDMTFFEFLQRIGISHKKYIQVIRSQLTKPQVFLKRKPCDMFISPFSIKMLTLMRSNVNIQFVLDPYSAACYIIDYINKSDRGISNLLRNVLDELKQGNFSLQKSLQKISNTFHNNSEMCIQEACYNILQLPMSKSSEECVFIPTFPPNQRVQMVKSSENLENLPAKSTDVFEKGLLDHYSHRPRELKTMTLAEFAANYTYSSKPSKKSMRLRGASGYINRRLKPRVIRYRNYHFELDPENYIREHLMLFHPWKNETRDLINSDTHKLFQLHFKSISKIKKQFNAFNDDIIEKAVVEANERSDDNPVLFESEIPIFDFDEYQLNDAFVNPNTELQFEDASCSSELHFSSPCKMTNEEYQNLFEKLNQDQRDFVMHIGDHFRHSQDQKLYFLTGGAGVGKSLVINTVFQTLFRIFNGDKNCDPDVPKILLCAPTGKAAFNIKGQTLHAAFRLPLNQKTLTPLSSSVANTLATKLAELKVLIIDEISMVGQHILNMVDERLQHLKGNKQPFGGVSVIAVGDFFQLKPVFARPLYSASSGNAYHDIFQKPMWHKFKVFQLTQIMRQNEKKFQTALNNLAKGSLTSADIDLFQSRSFPKLKKKHILHDAVHLFAKNKDVEIFNDVALNAIKGRLYQSEASDVIRGSGTQLARRQLLHCLKNSKHQDTMGIPLLIGLKVNAKYMISYNVDTNDGICNGATGTLRRIDFGKNPQGKKKPLRLWIEFDDPDSGALLRKKHSSAMKNMNIPRNWTPILPIALTVKTKRNSNLKVIRKQFPLIVAHALSIHKSQGLSLKKVVVHIKGRITRELLYVACSRAMTLNGLSIIGNFREPPKIDKQSDLALEVKRWKRKCLTPKFSFLHKATDNFRIIYHNVQSLHKHISLITNDSNFTSADILIFGETWNNSNDCFKIKDFKLIIQTDAAPSRKPRGVSIYLRKKLLPSLQSTASSIISSKNSRIDIALITFNDIIIIGIYARPNTTLHTWNKFFKTLPRNKKLIIIGDFNIDSGNSSKFRPFKHFLSQHQLSLLNKKQKTTTANTALDWIISNMEITFGKYASFFSFHDPIWTCETTI